MANAAPSGGTPGERLGSYALVRKLGRGGMGEVWLAEHVTIKSQVAIKLVLAAADDEAAASRFLLEAKATASIRHAGIVAVSDYGARPNGGAYLVMELLDGENLADRLERGALASDVVIDLGVQIAEALAAAHANDIIHRDLKPANVFLVRDSAVREGVRVKVVDFGVAKAAATLTDELAMTASGALVGTPVYMAPEQCTTRQGAIDPRADLYALGVVLYETLTGVPPFRGPTLGDLIDQHLNVVPISPRTITPAIPAKLDALVMNLLAKDRTDRPASANVVAQTLHELRGTSSAPGLEATLASADSAASNAATLATGVASHERAAPKAPAASIGKQARPVPRSLIYGLAGGALVCAAILAGIVMRRDRVADPTTLSLDEIDKRCAEADVAGCRELALRELAHTLPPPDFTRVAGAVIRACDGHDQLACGHLARLEIIGRGVRHDYVRARALATASCDAGIALGCEVIGQILADGIGGEVDGVGGLARRKRACELGSVAACHDASRSLRFGLGMELDVAAADQLLATAISTADTKCARGDMDACRTRALIYALGDGTTEDPVRAAPLLDRACRGGVAGACADLGNLYFAGNGVSRDPERGTALIEQGCHAGDDSACSSWVGLIAHGMSGSAEPAKAYAFAETACRDRGDRNCSMLADLYQVGIGVATDRLRAGELYTRACRGGIGDSCMLAALMPSRAGARAPEELDQLRTRGCSLGSFLSCGALGKAVQATDPVKAFALFQRACGLSSNTWGCESVAAAYLDGVGVAADPPRGRAILERACGAGTTTACRQLGRRLRDGKVLAKDSARAVEFFENACTAADPVGCRDAAAMLRAGDGIAADPKRAAILEARICTLSPAMCAKAQESGSAGRPPPPTK